MHDAEVTLRNGTPPDDAACLAIIRRAFGTVADELGFAPETHGVFPAYLTPERFARARAADAQLLVAELDGELVGCCFVGPARHIPDEWELSRLAVVPEARHRGVGVLLVRAAVARAADAGAPRLGLSIVAANRRLAAWYESLGFRRTGTSHPDFLPFDVATFDMALGPAASPTPSPAG